MASLNVCRPFLTRLGRSMSSTRLPARALEDFQVALKKRKTW